MGCKLISYCTNKRIFSEQRLSNTDPLTKFPSVELWHKDVGILWRHFYANECLRRCNKMKLQWSN